MLTWKLGRRLSSTHNRLESPHTASIPSEFWVSYAHTILEVWSELLLLWLDSPRGLHPSARASDLWTCPQTPPFHPISSKKVPIDGFWSWEFRIFKIRRKCLRNILEGGSQKSPDPLDHPTTPHPHRLDPYIDRWIAIDARIPNI